MTAATPALTRRRRRTGSRSMRASRTSGRRSAWTRRSRTRTARDRAVELSFRSRSTSRVDAGTRTRRRPLPIDAACATRILDRASTARDTPLYPLAMRRQAEAAFTLATPMIPQMRRLIVRPTSEGSASSGTSASRRRRRSTPSTADRHVLDLRPVPALGISHRRREVLLPQSRLLFTSGSGSWEPGCCHGTRHDSRASPAFRTSAGCSSKGPRTSASPTPTGCSASTTSNPRAGSARFPGIRRSLPTTFSSPRSQSDAASGTGTAVDGVPIPRWRRPSSTRRRTTRMAATSSSRTPTSGTADSAAGLSGRRRDPEIPAPSMWSVLTEYGVQGRLELAPRRRAAPRTGSFSTTPPRLSAASRTTGGISGPTATFR